MPDTYAESHITNTSTTPGAAAHRAAQKKTYKYANLSSTHVSTDELKCSCNYNTLFSNILYLRKLNIEGLK